MESRLDEECLRSIQESTTLAEYFQNIVDDCKVSCLQKILLMYMQGGWLKLLFCMVDISTNQMAFLDWDSKLSSYRNLLYRSSASTFSRFSLSLNKKWPSPFCHLLWGYISLCVMSDRKLPWWRYNEANYPTQTNPNYSQFTSTIL